MAFSREELKCCETAALSRIKLVLSKAHFILTTASGCIDATMKPRLGILLPEPQVQDLSSQQIFVTARATEAFLTGHVNERKIWLFYEMSGNDVMIDALQLQYHNVIDFHSQECVGKGK